MKKLLPLLLVAALLLGACAENTTQPDGDYLYYYPAAAESCADGALLTVKGGRTGTSLTEFLDDYLSAPLPENATAILPEGWTLQSAGQQENTVRLTFRGAVVTGLPQAMACVGLTRTLLQLPEVQHVSFTLPGEAEPLILTENDFFLTDTGMLPQEESVTLYFPDAQRRYLVKETVLAEAMDAEDKPAFIMQQLLSGTSAGQLNSCIPAGTTLLDISVEDGICTVNLSSQFSIQLKKSAAAERMAVYSIVNSLTELPEITTVDILVSGAPVEKLYLLDLSAGLTRDTRLLAADGSSKVQDVTIYPVSDGEGHLVAIPTLLEVADDQSPAEAAVEALLSYEPRDGLTTCVPAGTKLLSLRTSGGNCTVDLTGEFLAGCATTEEELLAVRAVIATLCAQRGIVNVDILVEGLEPAYRAQVLSGLHQSSFAWLAD